MGPKEQPKNNAVERSGSARRRPIEHVSADFRNKLGTTDALLEQIDEVLKGGK